MGVSSLALVPLTEGGYVEDFQDGRHRRYRTVRPYREPDDDGPDPGPDGTSEATR